MGVPIPRGQRDGSGLQGGDKLTVAENPAKNRLRAGSVKPVCHEHDSFEIAGIEEGRGEFRILPGRFGFAFNEESWFVDSRFPQTLLEVTSVTGQENRRIGIEGGKA